MQECRKDIEERVILSFCLSCAVIFFIQYVTVYYRRDHDKYVRVCSYLFDNWLVHGMILICVFCNAGG